MIAYLEPTANTRFFSIPHLTPAVKRRGKPITGSSKSPHEIKFVGVESEIMPHDLCQKKKTPRDRGVRKSNVHLKGPFVARPPMWMVVGVDMQ